jgi:hypothetical protein
LEDICAAFKDAVNDKRVARIDSTKLWFVNHVAIAMTARPTREASKTRHPSCSRIDIRIFTIEEPGRL